MADHPTGDLSCAGRLSRHMFNLSEEYRERVQHILDDLEDLVIVDVDKRAWHHQTIATVVVSCNVAYSSLQQASKLLRQVMDVETTYRQHTLLEYEPEED